jgi:hypothetical protein
LLAGLGDARHAAPREGVTLLPLFSLPFYCVLLGASFGSLMMFFAWRRRPAAAIREGATRSRISELETGRFHVIGRVVPIHTSASEVDGAACVYLERARYERVGRGLLPLLREVGHGLQAHRFYLDDGSGRILIDPAKTLIDCATLVDQDGLVAERRLRAGEEVEMIARFQPSDRPGAEGESEGPYRAAAAGFEAGPDDVGPPRISYRTVQGMERWSNDGVAVFLRGAGVLMIATSVFFGIVIMLWSHWATLHG